MDYTNTHLYTQLVAKRQEMLNRIAGCKDPSVCKWQKVWQAELAATQRALWALSNQA